MQQAYTTLSVAENKQIKEIRPTFSTDGPFDYTFGVAIDFKKQIYSTDIPAASFGTISLWGSALWGSGVWSSGADATREWITIPDLYSQWKSFYLQTASQTTTVAYLGADLLAQPGSFW
jgi:hypothetical protein